MYLGAIKDKVMQIYYDCDAKKAQKDLDKFMESSKEKNEKEREEIRKLMTYPETIDLASFCSVNAEPYPDLQTYLDNNGKTCDSLEKIHENTEIWRAARTGSKIAMSVIMMCQGKLKEGLVSWSKEERIAQTALMRFFKLPDLEDYDDLEDVEIPSIEDYQFPDNYGILIDPPTIRHAFDLVNTEDRTKKIIVNFEKGFFMIINANGLAGKEENINTEEVEVSSSKGNSETADEYVSKPLVFYDETIDPLDQPVQGIKFYEEGVDQETGQTVSEEIQKSFERISNFIQAVTPPNTKFELHLCGGGLIQAYMENSSIRTFDPNIVIGNGYNILATIKFENDGKAEYDNVLVNIDTDFEIASKVMVDGSYVLTKEEHQIALSRMFQNTNIYYYLDMSGMYDHIVKLSSNDYMKLGKKLTAIVSAMNDGLIQPTRIRFESFTDVNHFKLIADDKVKIPMLNHNCPNIQYSEIAIVEDTVHVYNAISKETVCSFNIEYNEI